ncbi:hypothetical protein BJF79_03325 [Actinomadura sp. CNU-125]|uniref:hypothetical protein n=1 Tax=Actinomadura sp. CNU-125 TaxID=1904961 RepID=UPI000964C289|nr:hypothetical protein [Actinomadura sp. CNU-125]OLT12944.1 hypothetical protein BJF79_03325 [Actinomadura sp. CNU-125]
MPTITLTPFTPWEHRSAVYGGRSTCGTWTYYLTGGRCEVTHLPTQRRFWALDIDRGREATATPEYVTLLLADPPAGKPLAKAELVAICDELTVSDARRMLQAAPSDVAEPAAKLIRPGAPLAGLHAIDAQNAIGIVYGRAPHVWLDALRTVRPDLVPARYQG